MHLLASQGPSATPLLLEIAFAAGVVAALAVRRPVSRLLASWRGKLADAQRSPVRARRPA